MRVIGFVVATLLFTAGAANFLALLFVPTANVLNVIIAVICMITGWDVLRRL